MRYLDRNVQVLFPVRLFYQSQGIVRLNSSLLTFLDEESAFQTDRRFLGEREAFMEEFRENRKCMDLAGRKKALCRRQGSLLCDYLKLHQRRKEKLVGYDHDHEQHYPACLSELINIT